MPYEKTPMEVVNDLRQVERFQIDIVADAIADALYRKPALELEPRELAAVRYAASLAIRRVQPVWEQAAKQQAIRKIRIALAEGELGRTLGHLPKATQAVIAAKLAPYAIESYLGVLEGSIPQEPGEYLRIVGGRDVQFRRELAASVEMTDLAVKLLRVRYQYEGRPVPDPIPPALLRTFIRLAERAVTEQEAK